MSYLRTRRNFVIPASSKPWGGAQRMTVSAMVPVWQDHLLPTMAARTLQSR